MTVLSRAALIVVTALALAACSPAAGTDAALDFGGATVDGARDPVVSAAGRVQASITGWVAGLGPLSC